MKLSGLWDRFRSSGKSGEANRNILRITYAGAVVFLVMAAYFAWFLCVKAESMIANPYNARLDSLSERVVRGDILDRDGKVLAETIVSSDGTETRVYPYNYLFTHSVGYMGNHGKAGLESLDNFYLLRSHVNLIEQTVNNLSGKKNPGDRVVTTLDLGLQQAADEAMGKHRGAIIVMEPDTGKVLALISQPNFNANLLDERWEEINDPESDKAMLLNRAFQGLYPPGSVFKLVTALEYMREYPGETESYRFTCGGTYRRDEYAIRCYGGEAHGQESFPEAFRNSCNGAFADIGLKRSPKRWSSTAESLLFNRNLSAELPSADSLFRLENDTGEWEVLQTAIGQGKTMVSPLHMAMLTAAIANGGKVMKPYLTDRVETVAGQKVKTFNPVSLGNIMTAGETDYLKKLMRAVVTDGTGSAFRDAPYEAAGKTGSAEVEKSAEPHSWFVGFAPADKPEVVIAVIAEQAGSGGAVAAPIARKVLDAWYEKEK